MKKMDDLVAAARRAEEETKRAEADQERERRLRHELQENIVNSAHDIKSPTTALSLAVESLLDILDNNEPISAVGRQRIVHTLHGMAHTISALSMIINRSVDSSKGVSGNSFRTFVPNHVPVDLAQILDGVMAYTQWQAEDTGIKVVMEPLPADLPEEIMVDEKWLRDDLLCVASNAVKYCRANQGVPALIRVAIVPPPTAEKGAADVPSSPSVQFSFIDSGYPLSDEKLTNLFDRPVHSERAQTGGMGLGLFCLSEHIQALDGQYGARRRTDGREGTEIWFSFPLLVPEADLDHFVMSDVGKDTHATKTHTSQRLGDVSTDDANNTTVNVADNPLFSSPQNRRPSVMKLSLRLKFSEKSSLQLTSSESSTLGDRGVDVRGGDIDSSKREGASGSVPIVLTEATPAPFEAASIASVSDAEDLVRRAAPSRKTIRNSRKNFEGSTKSVKEVLGALPILLVDDSVCILKMTKRAIQNECMNISFMEAKNGEEAFALVARVFASFELIVTDIQMPICNGFEFTRRVRTFEREKGLSPKLIIGISANDQQKISIEAKESGRTPITTYLLTTTS